MTRAGVVVLLTVGQLCVHGAAAHPQTQGVESAAARPPSAALATEEDKTYYTLGRLLGSRLAPLKLTPAEVEKILLGFEDAVAGRAEQVPLQEYGPKIDAMLRGRASADAEARKARDKAFAEKAAQEPGAEALPSGLVYRTLAPGSGPSPAKASLVKVNYEGKLTDGTVFDASAQRHEPTEFGVDKVIPCWTEGVQRMKVGEKARLVCPSSIAYGDHGRPPAIPPGATLVFDVELLEVREPAPAQPPRHP